MADEQRSKRARNKGPLTLTRGDFDLQSLGPAAFADLQMFNGVETPAEATERLRSEVRTVVDRIVTLTEHLDAFDLVELLRLREIPIVPVEGLRPGYDGSAAVIELVSVILLCREGRIRPGVDRIDSRPHEVIDELHDHASRLIRLATFRALATAVSRDEDELAVLAAEYQSYFVGVRGLQYESVQTRHDKALFNRPEIEELLRSSVGFSYSEFERVRDAVQERYSSTLTGLRDGTAEVMLRARTENREPTPDEIDQFRESMISMMFLPGERAAFTAQELVAFSDVSLPNLENILKAFSIGFDAGRNPLDAAMDFLRGVNPLGRTCLVQAADGRHIMTSSQIGSDSFRVLIESALKKNAKAWRRYDKTRAEVSEQLTLECVSKVLNASPAYANLKYYGPKRGIDLHQIGPQCTDPKLYGDQTESDGLFIIDDVAICVEVKGRIVAEAARRGDLTRFRREAEDILGAGAEQALRLQALIRTNGGLWLDDGKWLNLNEIREVRSVVVGLDFLGPLGIALGDLKRSKVLGDDLPWIASLHDLDVICNVLDRPSEFLLYLRRRSDSGISEHYRGSDELDLFMLFLSGGLYTEPDPDEVRRMFPRSPPATKKDRSKFRRENRRTRVGTYTDQLDAWMYWHEGTSPYEVEKPKFTIVPEAAKLVDFLEVEHKPGWFRFGSDFLGLSGKTLGTLFRSIREMVKRTRLDQDWHTLTLGFAGMWGYPTFFAGSFDRGSPIEHMEQRLQTYMMAKKHQVASDRSLGLLIDENSEYVRVIYLNDAPTANPELDDLVESMGLRSPQDAGESNRKRRSPQKSRKRRNKRRR